MSSARPSANTPQGGAIAFARWAGVLACAGLAAGGAMALWHGLGERWQNTEAAGWPGAEAQVLRGWVKAPEKQPDGTQRYRSQLHEVMVDYTFSVEGQSLTASSAAPRQIGDEEGMTAAQAIADSYAPGSTLPVYYQPGNPRVSRLCRVEISSHMWLWYAILGGAAVPVGLVGIWWMACRSRPKSC